MGKEKKKHSVLKTAAAACLLIAAAAVHAASPCGGRPPDGESLRGYGLVVGPDPFLLLRRRRDSAGGNEAGLDDGGQLYYDADGSETDTTNP